MKHHITNRPSAKVLRVANAKLAYKRYTDQDFEDTVRGNLTHSSLPIFLHHSAFEKHIGAMELLVSKGLKAAYLTPLHVGSDHLNFMYKDREFFRYVATTKSLPQQEDALIAIFDWGVGLDTIDERRMTLLQYAAECNDSQIVALLLQYEPILNIKSREKLTPVQLAENSGRHKIVHLLMRKAAGLEAGSVPRNAPKLAAGKEALYS